MFAGIDIASERHVLARLDATGAPIGRPVGIPEDRAGHDTLIAALGPLEEPLRRPDRSRA